MRNINLVIVPFNGTRHAVVNRSGQVVDTLTQQEFDALHAPDGRPPARIEAAWYAQEVCVFGNSPDYGNGTAGLLREGEICERGNMFELGLICKLSDGLFRKSTVIIPNNGVTVQRTGGLTIVKRRADAWDDEKTGIVSIVNGVLTTNY